MDFFVFSSHIVTKYINGTYLWVSFSVGMLFNLVQGQS